MSSEGRTRYDAGAVEVHDGTRAIEVAALFEDTVVQVHHFADPRAGVTRTTRALFWSAGAAATLALTLFGVAYARGAGPALDVIVLLALGYAAYAVVYGLLRLNEERRPRDFTVGDDRKALFPTAAGALPGGAFPLVRSTGDDFELCFPKNLEGDVQIGNERRSLADLIAQGLALANGAISNSIDDVYTYAIPDKAIINVRMGENTFIIASVPPPRRYRTPVEIDWRKQLYTGATALVAGAFLLLVNLIPPDPHSLALRDLDRIDGLVHWDNKPLQPEPDKLPDWLQKQPAKPEQAGGAGRRAAGASGLMGIEHAKNKNGHYQIKGPENNHDLTMAKKWAVEQAGKSGIIGIMRDMQTSSIGSVFGSDHALGNARDTMLGGLIGTEPGDAEGVQGLGLHGRGPGGDGTGQNTIGLTNLGTIGGHGNVPGRYDLAARLPNDKKKNAQIDPFGPPIHITGGIDKAIVRRVVHQHMNEVRFCYEKELERNNDLNGRVTAQFTIGGNGIVMGAVISATTMGNPAVEGCIAQAVRRWAFPKPEGGGIVVVSYPFMLHRAGTGN